MQLTSPAYSGKRLLLLLFPVCTIILSAIFLREASPFYHSEPDPCYAYLFDCTNLAGGNLETGLIAHPGTTTQGFGAAVIFIRHLFFSSQSEIYQDVLLNSESYLFTCSVVLIVLLVFVNYLTGAYIFRGTGSIGLAMLFQITPLINVTIIKRVIVLEPESFIIIASTFFMAYLFLNAPENNVNTNKQPNNKTTVLFAVFSGFLIATKYTCVPIVFLVLLILERHKQRLIYLGTLMVSFLFFVIPAIPKIKLMFQWVWNLFIHDGYYGTGEEGIINLARFKSCLKEIFQTDAVFTSVYIIITIAFLITLVNRIRKRKTVPFFRMISGIWLSISVLILAVAKHFDFHYFIFAECCFPLGIIVSYKIFAATFGLTIQSYAKYKKGILYSFFGLFVIYLISREINYPDLHNPKSVGVNACLDNYKNVPLIISTKEGLSCERIEPALFFGNMYTASLQGKYSVFLGKVCPDTYLYFYGREQSLWHWTEQVPITDFLSKNKSVLIYLKGFDDTAQVNIIHKFDGWNKELKSECYNKKKILGNTETLQNIYLLTKTQTGEVNGDSLKTTD